jgi:hypothetical protein
VSGEQVSALKESLEPVHATGVGETSPLRPGGPAAPSEESEVKAAGDWEAHFAHLTHPVQSLCTLVLLSVSQPRSGKSPVKAGQGAASAGPVCDQPLAPDLGWVCGWSMSPGSV